MATPAPKPADQPNPDAAILQGGPEGTPQGAPAAPVKPEPSATVTVKYGGQEFAVPPELGAALQAREQEFGRKLSEQGGELGELRKFRQSVQQTVTPTPPPRDLGTMLFENPNEALVRHKEEIKSEIRQEYTQVQNERDLWLKFFQQNEDLDGEQPVVQLMLQQYGNEIRSLPESDRFKKLGDLTRREIIRIANKFKGGGDEEDLPSGRAIVEGASTPRPKKVVTEPEKPKSLSEIIRAGRQRRLSPTAPKG